MTEHLLWLKSSYSGNGGQCIEWAPGQASEGAVPVRDSKIVEGPVLAFTTASWRRFVSGICNGQFGA
ncbi:DUF397 domain-containing protein [Streptomyces xiaopingdaonensis]|uniref:DUF397 domain-containing protein n=1 Tax=Streptomyces xiaopingdaonensis TaxID=1565415 RepID=UPI000995E357|nr:DUF397 domain-containing protein [Streptomyces xiaopingdaonensis]